MRVYFQINPSGMLPPGSLEKVAFCRRGGGASHNSNERLAPDRVFTKTANLDSILKKIECPLQIGERKPNKNVSILKKIIWGLINSILTLLCPIKAAVFAQMPCFIRSFNFGNLYHFSVVVFLFVCYIRLRICVCICLRICLNGLLI